MTLIILPQVTVPEGGASTEKKNMKNSQTRQPKGRERRCAADDGAVRAACGAHGAPGERAASCTARGSRRQARRDRRRARVAHAARCGAAERTPPRRARRSLRARASALSAAAVDGGPARRIGWHHDWCLAVVSVALSDKHLGGRLLFLLDGQVHCPARPVGSAIVHNRSAVHGVSTITADVRYNLIASFGDPKAADAA